MPTYDYQCEACGYELEIFHSMSAAPKRKCPDCGKLKLKRLIGTGAGVIFKGSGFYETDYRSNSYQEGAKAEKQAKESKAETKPDKKTEKKADAKPTKSAKDKKK